MTIWIDPPAWPAHGRLWSHLVSDTSFEELHLFAAANDIPHRGFEGDHYDVPEELYAGLVAAGARPAAGRDIVRILQASGLRIPKRRLERVLHSQVRPSWLPPGSRVDVIASRQQSPPANTVVVQLLALGAGQVLLVRDDDGGLDLPSSRVGSGTVAQALARVQVAALGDEDDAPLAGYVRNTVPDPDQGYGWPAPLACFAVFTRKVEPGSRPGTGQWLRLEDATGQLLGRHWWPLLPELLSRPGRQRP